MHIRTACAAMAVAGLQFFGSPASAAAIGTAAVSNFHIELVDLNPNDGIAPSAVWADLSGGKRFEVWGREAGESETWPRRLIDEFNADPGTTSFSQHGVAGAAHIATDGGTLAFGSDGLYGRSANYMNWGFVLSPFTRLVVSADYAISRQTESGVVAFGSGVLSAMWKDIADWDKDYSYAELYGDELASAQQMLSITLESGDAEREGTLFAELFVNVIGNRLQLDSPAEVPEPGSLALVGLGLAALVLRRGRAAA